LCLEPNVTLVITPVEGVMLDGHQCGRLEVLGFDARNLGSMNRILETQPSPLLRSESAISSVQSVVS
jgi:hypothetical protein